MRREPCRASVCLSDVIATAADRIVILDATRLYAESGGAAGL
jgi:alanyl-tRNA synthetase